MWIKRRNPAGLKFGDEQFEALVSAVSYFGDTVQVALALIATILMLVALNAYRRRSEGRYLMLAIAFVCLFAASVSTVFLELIVGIGPGATRTVEVYLIPALELIMALSFLAALLWSPKMKQRLKVLTPLVVILLGLAVVSAFVVDSGTAGNLAPSLPAGCVRPAEGFLIVASSLGYNDSVDHGGPTQSWPVLDASEGSNVTITICNAYQQAVGFQVVHYLENKVETVMPGQVLTLSFVADQKGTFSIYCQIFCLVHLYLQGGELRVT